MTAQLTHKPSDKRAPWQLESPAHRAYSVREPSRTRAVSRRRPALPLTSCTIGLPERKPMRTWRTIVLLTTAGLATDSGVARPADGAPTFERDVEPILA